MFYIGNISAFFPPLSNKWQMYENDASYKQWANDVTLFEKALNKLPMTLDKAKDLIYILNV